MPCPNDRREKSVTVGFRMTPEQKRWLDRATTESGMTKQDFIMARLHDEAITVAPNVRVYRALRDHMLSLLRELQRISAGGSVDERLHNEIERLTKEFVDLRGEEEPSDAITATRSARCSILAGPGHRPPARRAGTRPTGCPASTSAGRLVGRSMRRNGGQPAAFFLLSAFLSSLQLLSLFAYTHICGRENIA